MIMKKLKFCVCSIVEFLLKIRSQGVLNSIVCL